ncbi:MAG: FG-GAP repeat domain-containing protein, partial [Bacteroidia bacterium]
MKLRLYTFLLILNSAFLIHTSSAQPYFNRYDSIPVTINSNTLKFPWAGGLNSCQFSTIELNMDNIEDLFVFDRAGNKITTFINNGTAGTIDYTLAPEYRTHFVNQHDDRGTLHDWVLLRDYDMDGKKDIFTYSNGATAVYRNTTSTADSVTFELMTSFMKSFYNPNYLALYISPVDLPTFIDVDNDGDLDVLTFHISGLQIEYHSNQSQELYGHSDSLEFMLYDQCWGGFSENAASNAVYLDTCYWGEFRDESNNRHSGSTTLALDMNNDGVKEFMLGDISFKNLTLLSNDGTPQDAHMFEQNQAAPPNTTAADVAVFPGAYYEDVDNDNVKDLIVSPNTTNITENFNSVWLYKNNGITSLPEFEYSQNNFLQDNMIEVGEVSFPVFFDVDNDGLEDLIVGNYGYYSTNGNYQSNLSYYRNTGTANNPSFQLVTRDYAGIQSLGIKSLIPTFGDIDGDDVSEMIIGGVDGYIHIFENNSQPGQAASFVLSQPNFIDVGWNAAPQLFDVNGDTLLDLVIGERNGNLNYYENTGSANNPVFTAVSEDYGGVDVRKAGFNIGYSVPFMFKLNDELQLFVGSESGDIHQYINIEETLNAGTELQAEIGQGTTVSTDALTTPFGTEFKNGRNQFLIKAEELQSSGFQNGIIEKLAFNVASAAGGTIDNFKISLANRGSGNFTDFETLDFTTVFFEDVVIDATGWKEFVFDQKFTWDAVSDVLVQVCFDTTLSSTASSSVYCSSTSFISNVASSANNTVGCSMNSTTSTMLRPNMKLTLRPSFPKKGELELFEGVRSSVCGTDLNNDNLMDIAIGNYTGGVSYYKGDTTGIT